MSEQHNGPVTSLLLLEICASGALFLLALAVSVSIVLSGCNCCQPEVVYESPSPAFTWEGSPNSAQVYAGVVDVDITPPPGLSLFGNGPEGRVARGTRLRLSCQIFVLAYESADLNDPIETVAIVPCELGQLSTLLQRRVVAILAAEYPEWSLGADRVFLMATHTHAGPAHHFASSRYSGPFSSREYGYDARVLEWLASRIAVGIARAHNRMTPARVGWEYSVVRGLSRNRSFDAFALNPLDSLPTSLRDQLLDPWLLSEYTPAELAVDPQLSVLRIDRDNGPNAWGALRYETIGVLGIFGIHPNVIHNSNDLYHGDVFGYARRIVRERLETELDVRRAFYGGGLLSVERSPDTDCGFAPETGTRVCPVVVGFANGVEGDVSGTFDRHAPEEARRIGEALAEEVLRNHIALGLRPRGMRSDAAVRRIYRDLQMPSATVGESLPQHPNWWACGSNDTTQTTSDGTGAQLCATPEVGTGLAGGAADGPTMYRAVPVLTEGARLQDPAVGGCQGPKVIMSIDGNLSCPGEDFPALAPIGLLQIGNGAIVTVPSELTTVVGVRIREAVREVAHENGNSQIEGVALVGLTNGYIQYIASRCEYALQRYEAASTLYGPDSADFMLNQQVCLARDLFLGESATVCDRSQPIPNTPVQQPRPEGPFVDRMPSLSDTGELDLLRSTPEQVCDEGRTGWEVNFWGPAPGYVITENRLTVEVLRTSEFANDDSVDDSQDHAVSHVSFEIEDDDRGANIVLRHTREDSQDLWTATWTPRFSHGDWRCGRQFAIRINGPGIPETSDLFEVSCDSCSQ